MSRIFIRWVEALSRACGVASVLLLGFAMLVVCQMILMRYVFRAATIWQTEAVVFGATAAIFLGAPYVLMTKGHVGVDFIQMLVQPRTRLWMDRVGAWLGLIFCVVMAVASALYLFQAIAGGWTTPSVAAVPLWMPLSPVAFGFALLSLQYVAEIIKLMEAQP
ncbi:TRAP transporter small permease subunit [Castellaniella caeni]|uniref:TRAP transporter small permease subunit n=1 Tax=Castellaniella caeni TaxID=266123 RepID=UPI000830420E|nr:TRAP transporter small permease subunit [Castellaniella caeni]